MFIHPPLPRVTQSGCNPTSCSLPPKPTESAVSGNRTCSARTHTRPSQSRRETEAVFASVAGSAPRPHFLLSWTSEARSSLGARKAPWLVFMTASLWSHSVAPAVADRQVILPAPLPKLHCHRGPTWDYVCPRRVGESASGIHTPRNIRPLALVYTASFCDLMN